MPTIEEREIEILRTLPKSELNNFIEKNGQKLRELLSSDEELNDQEVLEALVIGYREI